MKKLKIGLFIDTFYPMIDGVVSVVDNYAKELNKIAEVVVFCPRITEDGYCDDFPYKVVRCHSIKLGITDYDLADPFFDLNFKKELEKFSPDIVHIHSPFSMGMIGVDYAKKHNIPCVGHLHSQYRQDFIKALKFDGITDIFLSNVMTTYNKCDVCWAVNERVKRLFVEEYGLKSNVTVQESATDFLPIVNKEQALSDVNQKYGLTDTETVFCFVGRLTVLKNILFIADSLKILFDKGKDFKMLFVGGGFDEELLKNKVKELGIIDKVIFTGKVSDKEELKKIYLRSKLLLFPSPYDTDGLVKYESASQGTPTLSLKGLYCASNLKDGENGFLSDDSPNAYAEKIMEICENDELYKKVQANLSTKLYRTWESAIQKVYADYLDLVYDKNLMPIMKVNEVMNLK